MTRLLLLALGLASCASTYRQVHYAPQPLEAVVQPVGSEDTLARVLISVRGIRYADETGYWLELRMRIENRSAGELSLAVDELLLVESDLRAFGPVQLRAEDGEPLEGTPSVGPGGSLTLDLAFPFPENREGLDLDGLNLKWGLRHPGGEEVLSSSFERLAGPSGYPAWEARPTLFFGFSHSH